MNIENQLSLSKLKDELEGIEAKISESPFIYCDKQSRTSLFGLRMEKKQKIYELETACVLSNLRENERCDLWT